MLRLQTGSAGAAGGGAMGGGGGAIDVDIGLVGDMGDPVLGLGDDDDLLE